MDIEQLTTEQMQDLWNEEATAREADPSPDQLLQAPTDTPPNDDDFVADGDTTPPVDPSPDNAPKAEEDPFASLPEAVKAKLAEIDAIKDANAQLLHHVKTAEGRVAAMQREFEQARKAQSQVAPQQAPSQQAIATAAANPEKWEQLKQDFPEWADAMEGYVAAKIAGISVPQGLKAEDVVQFVQDQMTTVKAEMGRTIEEAKIEGKYEDWKETVNSADFANWFHVQKSEIKALADSNNARDAIKMLDLFHEAKARPAEAIKQERGARLAAAAAPTKGNVSPPPKSVDNMTPEELWNFEARKREKTRAERGF